MRHSPFEASAMKSFGEKRKSKKLTDAICKKSCQQSMGLSGECVQGERSPNFS